MVHTFTATLQIIGVNPYVPVPEPVLQALLEAAGRNTGPVPVAGSVNGKPYRQTLVRYKGAWRLYINLIMLPDSPRRIGERLSITIAHDASDRSVAMPPALEAAFATNSDAHAIFQSLRPSLQKEINRYIGGLKSAAAIDRNVGRALDFLRGKGRFIGRNSIRD